MAYRKPLSKILNGVTRFGKLTVLGDGPPRISASGFEARTALVRCDCGTEKAVRAGDLRNGYTLSCGCEQRRLLGEVAKVRARTHGESIGKCTPEYRTWSGMRQRCHNPSNKGYFRYGARGIYVCDRWRDSFENFLADMGRRPGPEYSLDRIDNDGPYSPDNCRWATGSEQANNTRRNAVLEIGGERATVSEWASKVGVTPHLIFNRLAKGWSPRDAVYRAKRRDKRTDNV